MDRHNSPIRLLRFDSAIKHDPDIDRWFAALVESAYRDMQERLRKGAL